MKIENMKILIPSITIYIYNMVMLLYNTLLKFQQKALGTVQKYLVKG